MADERVNVVLNVVAQVKDAIASISGMQEAFNKLHVPPSISTNLTKTMTTAKREAEKYLDLINKPINGKTKMGAIDKQAETMQNAITKMRQEFEKIPGLKLDKMFNTSNLPDLAKFEQEATKLKSTFAQAFKQGFAGNIGSNFSTDIRNVIDQIKTDVKKLDISDINKSTIGLSNAFTALTQNQDLKSYDNFLDKFEKFQNSLISGGSNVQAAFKPYIDSIQKTIDLFQSQKLGQSTSSYNDFISQLTGNNADKAKVVTQAIQNLMNAAQGAAKASAGIGVNLGNATSQLSEFGKVAQKTASQTEQFKSRLEWFFGAYNAINLFKRTIRSAFNTIKDLDKAMTETAVVTDYTVSDMWKQLSKYTETASSLGATTKGAYETLTLYYQQGLNSTQAMQLGTETMKMARIAGIEYAEATDMMTAALRGFNMALNEDSAQRVNDVYSQLAAKTAASTEEIAVAMTKTASIANSANMDFETTAAFLTQIIETTREAPETAGTAMKTVIARFSEVKKLFSEGSLTGVDEEGEAIDINKIDTALKSVGMSLKKYILGQEGLDDVFLELASKWDTLDMATQRYIATQAAGSRQQSRFIAMMSNYSRTMELVDYAEQSAGAGQAQFEKTLDSMESKLNQLTNAWNDFTLGIANNDAVKTAVSMLTKLLEVINKLTSSFGSFGGIATKVGLGIGAFVGGNRLIQGASVRNSIKKDALGSGMSVGQYLARPDKATEKNAWDNAFRNSFRNNRGVDSSYKNVPLFGKSQISEYDDRLEKLKQERAESEKFEDAVKRETAAKKELEELDKNKGKRGNGSRRQAAQQELRETKKIFKNAPKDMRSTEDIDKEYDKIEKERNEFKFQQSQHRTEVAKQAAQATGIALMLVGQGITAYQENVKKSGNTNAQQQERLKATADSASIMGTSLMVGSQFGPWGIAAGAAIGGVISAFKLIDAWTESAAEKTERLNKAVSESAQRVTDLTNGYSQLKSSWQNYTQSQENLATLTRGTQEYNDAVIKQNQTVLELVEKNKSLVTTYDENTGALTITKESYDQLVDSQNKQIKAEQKMYNVHQMMALQDERANLQKKEAQAKDVTTAEIAQAIINENPSINTMSLYTEIQKYFDHETGIYDIEGINKKYKTNLRSGFSSKEQQDYDRQLKENEIRFQGFAKNWAAQSISESEKYSNSVVDIISDIASKEMAKSIDEFGETEAFKDFEKEVLDKQGDANKDDLELAKKYYAEQMGVDVSTIDFEGRNAGQIWDDAIKMAYATQEGFSDIVNKYSDDYDKLDKAQQKQIANLDNLKISDINKLFSKENLKDNEFLNAVKERYDQDRVNVFSDLNDVLSKFTNLDTLFYNDQVTNKQAKDLATYSQMFGQTFGKDTGSYITAAMLESFKPETTWGPQFQKVIDKLNFSNAITGISQIDKQIELNINEKELVNTLKNIREQAFKDAGGQAGILSQMYKSDEFADVIDKFHKITKAGNEITADAIYDAADGCAILDLYLDEGISSASTLAMILNDLSVNGGSIENYSNSLIQAVEATQKVQSFMDESKKRVKNYQQVESDTQVGQFYGSRAKEIQTGFENGSWGDRQLIQSIGQFGSKASSKYANFMKSFGGGMITRDQLLTQFNKQLGRYDKVFKQVAETGNLGAVWSNLGLFSDIYDKGRNKKGPLNPDEEKAYKAFTDLVTIKNGQVNLSKQGIDTDTDFDTITEAIKGMFPDDPEFAEDLITDLIVNSPDMYGKFQTKQIDEGIGSFEKSLKNGEPVTKGDIEAFMRMYKDYMTEEQKNQLTEQKNNAIDLEKGWSTGKTATQNVNQLNEALGKKYGQGNYDNALSYYLERQGALRNFKGREKRKNIRGFQDLERDSGYQIVDTEAGAGLDIDKTISALQKLGMSYEDATAAAEEHASKTNESFKKEYTYIDAEGNKLTKVFESEQGQSINDFLNSVNQSIQQIQNENLATTIANALGNVEITIDGDVTTLSEKIDSAIPTSRDITINYVPGTGMDLLDRTNRRHGQPGARRNAIPGFAEGKQGSRHNYEGIALVGEEGPELVSGDDGMRIVGQNGEELTYVHKEDAIYTNQDTRKLLGGTKSHIPGFAEGNSSLDDLIKVLNRLCEELMNMKIRIEYPDQSTEDSGGGTSGGGNGDGGTGKGKTDEKQPESAYFRNQDAYYRAQYGLPPASTSSTTSETTSSDYVAPTFNKQNKPTLESGLQNKYQREGLEDIINTINSGKTLTDEQSQKLSEYDTTNLGDILAQYRDQAAKEEAARKEEEARVKEETEKAKKIADENAKAAEGQGDAADKNETSADANVEAANITTENAKDNDNNANPPSTTETKGEGKVETEPLEIEATLHGTWGTIDPLEPVTVPLTADSSAVTSAVATAVAAVKAADGTTANFDFVGHKVGFWPVSGGSGVGAAFGSALASGTYQSIGGNTLVGELGQEMVVDPHNGSWYTVGDTGAEFASLPKDAIVFNHKQTEGLLKYGRINNRGRASAFGNAMYTGYTGGTKTRASHNRSGGRGGSGSNKDNEWKNPYDRFYNLIEDIDRELKRQTGIQKKIDKASRDNSLAKNFKEYTTTHKEELKLMQDMTDSYRESMALNKELLEGKEWELQNFMDEHSDMLKYGWYDFDKDEVQMNWDLINSVKDTDTGKKIEEYISGLEKLNDKFWDAAESYDDAAENIRKQVDEARDLIQEQREGYLDLEERVIDALIDARQKEIDKLSEISDTLDRDNGDILDSVRDMVDEQRRLRDLQEQQDDLEKKQRRLALLRRDSSGANALEIMQLEEELKNDTRNLTDTLVDQGLDKLEKANEEAQKQRERQIELLSNLLEIDKENGAFNVQAQQLIAGALNNDEDQTLNVFSDMVALLQEAEGWVSKSIFAQQEWIKELKSATFVANQGLEYFLNTQLEDTIISAMEKETARGEGTTITDLSGNSRTLVNKYSQEDIAAQGEKVKEAYDNAAEARRALQEFEDIDYKDWLTQNGYKNNSKGKAAYQKEYNRLRTAVEEADIEKLNQDRIASAMARNVLGYIDENGNFVEYVDTSEIDTENHKSQYYYDGKYYDTMTDAQMAKNQALEKSQTDLKDIQKKFNTLEKEYQKALTAMNNAKADYLIAASTSGEDSKAAKSASDTYTKKKKAYDEAYNKYQAQKSLLNSQNEVIEELQYLQIYGPFKQGGLANFTGLAKLDGTPSRPEAILDAKDTKNFIQLKNVLRDLELNGLQGGNTYYEVHIDVDKLESDYDVDKVANRVKELIVSSAQYRNNNTINHLR